MNLNRNRVMQKLISFVVVFLFPLWFLSAQTGWYQVHPYSDGSSVTTSELWDVHFIDTEHGFAVGEADVIETTDGGETWKLRDLGVQLPAMAALKSVTFVDDSHGWIAGWYGSFYRTTNGGQSWEDHSFPSPFDFEKVFFIDPLNGWVLGDSSHDISFNGAGCILKTSDGGFTWTSRTFFPPPKPDDYFLSFFDIQIVTASIGYAAGTFGGVAKTTDGGETWTQIDIPWRLTFFALHFYDANHGVLAGEYEEAYTEDGGMTWTRTSPNWGHTYDFEFTSDSKGYAVGAWLSQTSNGGATWFRPTVKEDVHRILKAIHFVDSITGWAVGADGQVLRTTDGGVVSAKPTPTSLTITMSISPQPLMPGQQSTIQVSIPTAGDVSLHVYDLLGRLVQTVHEGQLSAGQHQIDFRVNNAKPGIYFIRMTTGEQQVTRKLLVR